MLAYECTCVGGPSLGGAAGGAAAGAGTGYADGGQAAGGDGGQPIGNAGGGEENIPVYGGSPSAIENAEAGNLGKHN